MENINLYNEVPRHTDRRDVTGTSTTFIDNEPEFDNEILITLDFSKETFGEMVEKVRKVAQDLPELSEINLFILSGYLPHPDAALFLEYIKSLRRPFKFLVRGIIHLDFMQILSFPNLYLIQGSKLKFDPKRLQEFQVELLQFPQVFRVYFQRYIDEYHKYKSEVYFDMTEMKTLGFNFQTY